MLVLLSGLIGLWMGAIWARYGARMLWWLKIGETDMVSHYGGRVRTFWWGVGTLVFGLAVGTAGMIMILFPIKRWG